MKITKNKKIVIISISVILLVIFMLSLDFSRPKKLTYGVSFSRFHTDELKLDWMETYLAILNDLGVRNFRFSAHWPLTEPEEGKYNFEELDFQIEEARKRSASVILAVGRRLPGWPECHVPDWLKANQGQPSTLNPQPSTKEKEALLKYIETVVNRYKSHDNIIAWQVENEPFLAFFSRSACGPLDREFLDREIAFVKKLDPSRSILITDSGEFGNWFQAYKRGDIFGTSLYLYIWWRDPIGPFRYPITPAFFRIKRNLTKLIYGDKPSVVIELSAEPWLRKPILETPMEIQLERMGVDKFNEMINFSSKTGFDTFYLWGVEWWYWLKKNGHNKIWNQARDVFSE